MPKCNLTTFLVNCDHDDRNPQHEFSKSKLVTQIKHQSNDGKWKIWPQTWPQKWLAKCYKQRTLIQGHWEEEENFLASPMILQEQWQFSKWWKQLAWTWTMIALLTILEHWCAQWSQMQWSLIGELNENTSDSSLCVHHVWQICAWQIGRYLVLFISLDYHLLQLLPDFQHLRIFLIRYLKWMHYVVHFNPIATWLFFWHLFPDNSPLLLNPQFSLNFGA